MNKLPLSKRAEQEDGLFETIVSQVWNFQAGPLENLFNLAENLGIIFGGGWASLILLGLKAAGIDGADLGRLLDSQMGLKTLSDLGQHSPEELAEKASEHLEAQEQSPTPAPGSDDDFGPPIRTGAKIPLAIQKKVPALPPPAPSARPQAPRTRAAAPAGRLFGSSRKGLLTKIFAPMFGWLGGDRKLARALRALGVVEAANFHEQFSNHLGDRYKTENGGGGMGGMFEPTKKTPQEQLETAVDHILGEA